MNVNYLGLAGIALAFVFFAGTFRSLRGKPLALRVKWLMIFGGLTIPAVLYAAYYLHRLPESASFYEFRSWPGTELLVMFAGGFGGALASLLPRPLLVIPLLGMTGLVLVPFLKPLLLPIGSDTFYERRGGRVCLQSTPSTCGPASVITILQSFGATATEQDVARAAYSYQGGTEAWYLARYIRSRGLTARFKFAPGFLSDNEWPVVAGVRIFGYGHFIPMLGRTGDLYVIGDPMRGKEELTEKQLKQRYEFTGFYLVISRR